VTPPSPYPDPRGRRPPSRDAVKVAYEDRWTGAFDMAADLIARGERDLSRLVYGVRDKSGWPPTPEIEALYGMIRSRRSIYRLRRDLLADKIIEDLAPDTDAIVEVGAGWGCNLFFVWLRGGPSVPYHCLEIAESGRRACELIAGSAAASPQIATSAFDFYEPDFSSIAGRYRHPLVFTCASIDKVNPLPVSYIDGLLDIAPQVSVVSMEFLGWQLALEQGVQDEPAIAHVRSSGLNDNFIPLLREREAQGRIAIDETVPELLGPHMSYLRWRKLA
jgi:hypothetical protein